MSRIIANRTIFGIKNYGGVVVIYFIWLLYESYIKYDSVIESCVCTPCSVILFKCTAYYRCIHQFIKITPHFRDYYRRRSPTALLITDVYTDSLNFIFANHTPHLATPWFLRLFRHNLYTSVSSTRCTLSLISNHAFVRPRWTRYAPLSMENPPSHTQTVLYARRIKRGCCAYRATYATTVVFIIPLYALTFSFENTPFNKRALAIRTHRALRSPCLILIGSFFALYARKAVL